MTGAFMSELARILAEITVVLAAAVAILMVYILIELPRLVRQWRCPHPSDRIREGGQCKAHCQLCNKNLGFVWEQRRDR